MEWYEIELDGRRTCNFPERTIPGYNEPSNIKPLTRGDCLNSELELIIIIYIFEFVFIGLILCVLCS